MSNKSALGAVAETVYEADNHSVSISNISSGQTYVYVHPHDQPPYRADHWYKHITEENRRDAIRAAIERAEWMEWLYSEAGRIASEVAPDIKREFLSRQEVEQLLSGRNNNTEDNQSWWRSLIAAD